MKRLTMLAIAASALTAPAIAGPLDGIERNIDKNSAMRIITSGVDGNDYAATDGNDVLLGSDVIGIRKARGGSNASDNSVVTPWVATGCTSGTRVNLPTGGGSSCDD